MTVNVPANPTSAWENPLPGVPDVESPFFEQLFESKDDVNGWREIATSLNKNGFAVFDFPDPDILTISEQLKNDLRSKYDWQEWKERGWKTGGGLRFQDAWKFDDSVRRIACNETILKLLKYLYGRNAIPFQTLNFPVGTQQHFHSDSVHFNSVPERYVAGVWVAMEDVTMENGPLIYYSGSHRLPIYLNEHIGSFHANPRNRLPDDFVRAWETLVKQYDLRMIPFLAKKGQAVIWTANLLHGGMTQSDPKLTRWSQVTHYYFDDCAYYSPVHSDPFIGRIWWRKVIDIRTGNEIKSKYINNEIPDDFINFTDQSGETSAKSYHYFDPNAYLEANPDVKAAGADPVKHYIRFGIFEGRRLRT